MALPFKPEDVEYYEVAHTGQGIVAIALNLKTGGQRMIEGDELTEEVKQFVLSQQNKRQRIYNLREQFRQIPLATMPCCCP
jgi:hypothetical protein